MHRQRQGKGRAEVVEGKGGNGREAGAFVRKNTPGNFCGLGRLFAARCRLGRLGLGACACIAFSAQAGVLCGVAFSVALGRRQRCLQGSGAPLVVARRRLQQYPDRACHQSGVRRACDEDDEWNGRDEKED